MSMYTISWKKIVVDTDHPANPLVDRLVILLFDRRIKKLEKKTAPVVSSSIYNETGISRLAACLVHLT
ncbi:hypothetical protein [Pollutibacter soli]|uniref:hypothetical protein n=1 Tax=Pollutibacter soli TaxID=3034157 RepID=UPI003013BE4B